MTNRVSATVTTEAEMAPVDIQDAKAFLRLDGNSEDSLINDLIYTATEMAENYTRRAFINRTLKLTLDAFPPQRSNQWWDGTRDGAKSELITGSKAVINLPYPPIVSITSIITYNDSNTSSTFDSSSYTVNEAHAQVLLNSGYTWPVDLRHTAAIEVTYVAGYGTQPSNVPSSLKHGILMIVNALYNDRYFRTISIVI